MILTRLKWWWRTLWGNCPNCNCDAPKTDTCRICDNYRHQHAGGWEPPTWWRRMFWLCRLEEVVQDETNGPDAPETESRP